MTQFQVRISGEAAYYLRMLKEKYETSEGINITKATILTRAFQNSKTVTNWTKVVVSYQRLSTLFRSSIVAIMHCPMK